MAEAAVSTSLGLFAAILGNMSIVTYAVDAKYTVAIQCRGGWSPGALCVFDGSLEPKDRYEGMRLAFGGDMEILKPDQQGDLTHEKLDAAGYKQLLANVTKRSNAANTIPPREPPPNDSLRDSRLMPLHDWSRRKFGRALSLLYTILALGPLVILFAVKICLGERLVSDMVYFIFFLVVKTYCRKLLDVRRYVRYIKIARRHAELDEDRETWDELWRTAGEGRPTIGEEALGDIKLGRPRRLMQKNGPYYLLVPVISLESTTNFDTAQWWFIARRFRGPLLATSYLFPGSKDHRLAVAFAICAFVQACLQDDAARVFLASTNTYHVNWFRHLSNQRYPEEHEEYKCALG